MRHPLKYLALLGVCVLSFVAISCHRAQPDTAAKAALAQELAAAKKEGLPVSAQQLQAPSPPPEQDAAPIYAQLIQLHKAQQGVPTDDILYTGPQHNPPSASELERLRRALSQQAQTLALIHKAASRPQCVFVRGWLSGQNLSFPEFTEIREDMRLLTSESMMQLFSGAPLEAVRTEAFGFHIAQHAASDPTLNSYNNGIASDDRVLAEMERILYHAGDDAAVDDAVRKAIEQQSPHFSLARALRGEAGMSSVEFDKLRTGQLTVKNFVKEGVSVNLPDDTESYALLIDRNQAMSLHLLREASAVADDPYAQSYPVFQRIADQIEKNKLNPNSVFASGLTPVFPFFVLKLAQNQAQTQVLRCGAAVLEWRASHGASPRTLDQAISPVPADPFDGKPLRYRQEGQGFVVYSVGPTGKFDGGKAHNWPPPDATLFRYPLPAIMR